MTRLAAGIMSCVVVSVTDDSALAAVQAAAAGGPDDMTTPFPRYTIIGNVYTLEVDIAEATFHAVLAGQPRAAASRGL